jgi:hypothetical protein
MSDPTAVLLADLVDDAGLFPPTQLGMAEALDRYRRTSATAETVLSHRFVCPAARLPELQRHLGPDEQVGLSVILEPRLDQVAELNRLLSADPRLRLAAVETCWPGADLTEARRALAALPQGLPVFVEVPIVPAEQRDRALDELARFSWAAKLRCGGVRADLFPSPTTLAKMIGAVVGHRLSAKATAGLHHAIGYTDPMTRFDHFGFLNLLLAVHQALIGAGPDDLVAVLCSRDEGWLVDAVRALDASEAEAVRHTFNSYGSCDTEEPIEDLERLGLHPARIAH